MAMTVKSFACPSGAAAKKRNSKIDKRQLLLSVATLAVLAIPAFANTNETDEVSTADVCVENVTCIRAKKTSPYTTSDSQNIYVFYDDDNGYGRINFHKDDTAAITIDSDNYAYVNGYLSNTKSSGAVGIKVDLSESRDMSDILRPKTTGDCEKDSSGCTTVTDSDDNIVYTDYEFENYEEEYVTGAAIYLDEEAKIYLTGKGNNKVGIWLDADGATGTTLTGNIIAESSSVITIKGDNSYGLLMDEGTTLVGNIELGSTVSVYPHKTKSKYYSGIYGMYIGGYVDGNVQITGGGSVTTYGNGSVGMMVTGSGVSGNLMIEGTLTSSGSSSSYKLNGHTHYAEAAYALAVNTSIDKGIEITGQEYSDDASTTTGSVTAITENSAIIISPVVTIDEYAEDGTYTTTSYTSDSDVVIGLYQSYDDDTQTYTYEQYAPGYAFYNRGSVVVSPKNKHSSAVAAIDIGGADGYNTYLDGGFYNSGSITSSATATRKKKQSTSATAILFDSGAYIGGYYDEDGTYGTAGTYYADSISCDGDDCTYSSDSEGIIDALLASEGYTKVYGAAFVNDGESGSGSISASVSGKGGGTATAIEIADGAYLSSIYNSGTISATATTTKTSIAETLAAYAIQDKSGTLTYIYNSGTISASATSLDSDDQIAIAIDLSSDEEGDAAYDGVTIVSESDGESSTTISGDINFGSGDNQQIYMKGAGSSYMSKIVGNVYYGKSSYYESATAAGTYDVDEDDSGDVLSIGAFSEFYGGIYAWSPVDIDIANNGELYITNSADDCDGDICDTITYVNAGTINVYDGGYLTIDLDEASGLNSSGYIQANGDVFIEDGATLGIGYDSYITSGDYTLLSTTGDLTIEDFDTYKHDLNTPMTTQCDGADTCGELPFLFESQELAIKYYDADGKEVESASDATTSKLVVTVQTKTADELQLTGYAKKIFSYANEALEKDDDLGAAMINGVHGDADDLEGDEASEEAQRAYDSFAPNVTGGTRAIAVAITDQATGVVAARQRALRNFSMQEGDLTLWTQEFVQQLKNPGQGAKQEDGSRGKTGFRDHGFGVVIGMDAGNPSTGWYGGALTYFSGDVNEIGKASHENQTWVVGTGYASVRGHGWFFDAKMDAGYGHIKGLRHIKLVTGTGSSQSTYVRYAQNAHSALMVSGGISGGTSYTYGAFTFQPQASVDGLALREDGYTEFNPADNNTDADGFSLKVKRTFATSLRAYLGTNVRYDLDLGDNIFMQPEVRAGFRYDFLADPLKLKAAFKDLDPDTIGNQSGSYFSLTGPRPSAGSIVLGSSVGLISGAWSLNLNYDFVRGANMNIEQAATLNLVGRI